MKKLILAASAVAFLAMPGTANAGGIVEMCSLHYCIASVCGSETHCGPVQRCYYFTDYPTCIYP